MNETRILCDIRMEREVNQILWYKVMGELGSGWDNVFENDTFAVRAYDWDDEVYNNDWHFWHKPSGFMIQWYKYPLRSPQSNMDISNRRFLDILYDCHNSMRGTEYGDGHFVIYSCNKWWEEKNEK